MAGLGVGEAARRENPGAGRDQPRHQRGGASRARRRAHRALRAHPGARKRHGGHRLRLRAGPVPPPRTPEHRVGEARGARSGRPARHRGALEVVAVAQVLLEEVIKQQLLDGEAGLDPEPAPLGFVQVLQGGMNLDQQARVYLGVARGFGEPALGEHALLVREVALHVQVDVVEQALDPRLGGAAGDRRVELVDEAEEPAVLLVDLPNSDAELVVPRDVPRRAFGHRLHAVHPSPARCAGIEARQGSAPGAPGCEIWPWTTRRPGASLQRMKALIPAALGLVSGAAMAAATIESVHAKQVAPLEVMISVAIKRTTPLDQYCDALVDLGDGTS